MITPETAADMMRLLLKHIDADELLCAILIEQGFEEAVALFKKMRKWYA
jgi:hypothetical protein